MVVVAVEAVVVVAAAAATAFSGFSGQLEAHSSQTDLRYCHIWQMEQLIMLKR